MLSGLKNWLGLGGRASADGELRYAVGDIHGRRDLLAALLRTIQADRQGRSAEIVFLGDYVDRGDDSAGVVTDLVERRGLDGLDPVFLKGNHEAVLLQFLDDLSIGPRWAEFGGLETLISYGVRPPQDMRDLEAWSRAREALLQAMPDSHRDFYDRLELVAERGRHLFVHAGIDPARPVIEQGEAEFLWIREPFLKGSKRLPWIVVHGHTPQEEPSADRRRIGIDTGAYLTGKLTAVRLMDDDIVFLST